MAFEDSEDKAHGFPVPNEWFRFGIIPSGSTDAIVIWYFFLPSILEFSVLLLHKPKI